MTAVVVAGALANRPGNGGEAWVRLGWLRGLADLGVDVHVVESADVAPDGPQAAWYDDVVAAAGLAGRAVLLAPDGTALRGDRGRLLDLAGSGAPLLDLSGTLADPALVAAFRSRAYVDLDPGWTQLWDAAGLLGDVLNRYDVHLTVGDAVPTCGLPLRGRRWQVVRPVVVTADWDCPPPAGGPLTTVATWRSPVGTMPYGGRELGGKARSWRPLAALPAQVPQRCLAVVAAHPADDADLARLREGGWELAGPERVGTPERYRAFVQGSAGEMSVAQEMYVATGCGWTSDRTAAYLAAGRPAVVQDTGFGADLRGGPALRPYTTCAQAVAACRALAAADPGEVAEAARGLAARAFSSRAVLPRVLDLAGAR